MLYDEHKGMKKMLSPTMNPTSVTFRFCAPNYYARKIKTTSKKNTTVTRMNQKRKKRVEKMNMDCACLISGVTKCNTWSLSSLEHAICAGVLPFSS